jgi:hypothetical protein
LFKLIGTKSNKAAIGGRVTVTTVDGKAIDEVRAGGSYMSQNDLRLHFGLAQQTVMSNVEIAWPSGKTENLKDLPADFIYIISEGGDVKKVPLSR